MCAVTVRLLWLLLLSLLLLLLVLLVVLLLLLLLRKYEGLRRSAVLAFSQAASLLLSSVEPSANGKATSTSLSTTTCSSATLSSVNVASSCVRAPQVERGALRWLRLPR